MSADAVAPLLNYILYFASGHWQKQKNNNNNQQKCKNKRKRCASEQQQQQQNEQRKYEEYLCKSLRLANAQQQKD